MKGRRTMDCRGRAIELGKRTLIMGILNVTPDSFSDGGHFTRQDDAVSHGIQLVEEGADIIDIGGESTRPGAAPVSAEEELKRVIPVIEALRTVISVPISIDTYKARVAGEALAAGAHMVNDVWGLQGDPGMAAVAAQFGAPVIVMHNREMAGYTDLLADVTNFLNRSIELAVNAGIRKENIIVDPGIGFGKTFEDNLMLMNRLDELHSLGQPILLGPSRKSMIGRILDLPPNERVEGTIAAVVYGVVKGVDIVRVHDVKQVSRAVRVADALVNRRGVL